MTPLEEVIAAAERVFLPHAAIPAQVEMIVVDLLGEMAKGKACGVECEDCRTRADRSRQALTALGNTSWRAEAPPFAAGRPTQ